MRLKKIALTGGHEVRGDHPNGLLETFENVHDPSGLGVESSRYVGGACASQVKKQKKQLEPPDARILASGGLDFQM